MKEVLQDFIHLIYIYIQNGTVYYNRRYKKLFLIIANGLPIVNIIFVFLNVV